MNNLLLLVNDLVVGVKLAPEIEQEVFEDARS